MTWKCSQSLGRLARDGSQLVRQGCSGNGIGKNDPPMRDAMDAGPIPVGDWPIESPFHHPHAGNHTMRLRPSPMTETCGHTGFVMHGDSAAHPVRASGDASSSPFRRVSESGKAAIIGFRWHREATTPRAASRYPVALLCKSPVCSSWPTSMAIVSLKNAGMADPATLDDSKTNAVLLASEEEGRDLCRHA